MLESVGIFTNAMDIRMILLQLGLDEKEVTVYLAALELGMAPISLIAKKAGLKRPTTYVVMKRLRKKNMTECFLSKHTKCYSVISPASLQERYQQYVSHFHKALPQLLAVHNHLVRKPRVTFYEGKEELTKLYGDVLTSSGEVLNYFLPEKVLEYFGEPWLEEQYFRQMEARRIPLRAILSSTAHARAFQTHALSGKREMRRITRKDLLILNEVFIYDDKVSTFSFDEGFALLIQSKDVADSQRTMFELAWNSRVVE